MMSDTTTMYYLVYYDMSYRKCDIEDVIWGWTNNSYCAYLRASFIRRLLKSSGKDSSKIKIASFRSKKEMEQFVLEFEGLTHGRYIEFEDYELLTCETLSSIGHHLVGVWTSCEINEGHETIINAQNDFRDVILAANALFVCGQLMRNRTIYQSIEKLYRCLTKYHNLYQLGMKFSDDISLVDSGEVGEDFVSARRIAKEWFDFDIATIDIEDYWFGLFDDTRMLINLAGLGPIDYEGGDER